MNSIRNLSDAGKLLPAWTLPLVLTISIMGALFYAQNHLADRPHLLVAQGTLYAVIASALAAAWLLLVGILNAKPGRLKESIGEGVVRGLNFMWSTSSVALVIYLGANHSVRTRNRETSAIPWPHWLLQPCLGSPTSSTVLLKADRLQVKIP